MKHYINDITEVSDITYMSELTRHEAWRVQFAQQLIFTSFYKLRAH